MKKDMSFREMLGQMLFITVDGTEITDELRKLVSEYKCGNIVLFQPNIVSIDQLKKFCADFQALTLRELGTPALIAVDQEGGGVTRLSNDFVNVPGAMAIAVTGDPEVAYRASAMTADELRAVGVNFNFAPVADICNNPDNPVIGARCWGETPEQVSAYVTKAFRGTEDHGIASCAKHFPGHGDTHTDSHLALPIIDKSLPELENFEFKPFVELIRSGCPAVMTAHIVYPQIENSLVPATMSRVFLTDILRGKLGFDGLILTDSLEMNAIRQCFGAGKGALAALQAGCDMLLTGCGADIIIEEIEVIEAAYQRGEINMDEISASLRRIEACKEKYCLPPKGEAGLAKVQAESDELRRRSICLFSGKLPALGEHPLFVGPKDYRLTMVANETGLEETFPHFMAARFGGQGIATENVVSEEEIERAVKAVSTATCVVANLYNAHVFHDQLRLFEAVKAEALRDRIPVVAICLRDPADLEYTEGSTASLQAWDYSQMSLNIIAEVLSGQWTPTGKLPVTIRNRMGKVDFSPKIAES